MGADRKTEEERLISLMIGYQKGSMDDFEGLYAALRKPLLRYLWTFVRNAAAAEDLLQDTFLQIHRARQTYMPPRPVRPWVYAITRHVALMHLRSRRRRKEVLPDDQLPEVPVPPEMETLADRATLHRMLSELPRPSQEVLMLHHLLGMSFKEVGQILGIVGNFALDTLGPAYRWKTNVYALGEISGGRLDGDLLLKGYGDPFLVTERVWQMLRRIRHAGIDTIEGDLLIDDSYFDVGEYDPGAFDRQPLRVRIEALMSAGPYDDPNNVTLADFIGRIEYVMEHGEEPPGSSWNDLGIPPGPSRGRPVITENADPDSTEDGEDENPENVIEVVPPPEPLPPDELP